MTHLRFPRAEDYFSPAGKLSIFKVDLVIWRWLVRSHVVKHPVFMWRSTDKRSRDFSSWNQGSEFILLASNETNWMLGCRISRLVFLNLFSVRRRAFVTSSPLLGSLAAGLLLDVTEEMRIDLIPKNSGSLFGEVVVSSPRGLPLLSSSVLSTKYKSRST